MNFFAHTQYTNLSHMCRVSIIIREELTYQKFSFIRENFIFTRKISTFQHVNESINKIEKGRDKNGLVLITEIEMPADVRETTKGILD